LPDHARSGPGIRPYQSKSALAAAR
jgi:hypothetical protein